MELIRIHVGWCPERRLILLDCHDRTEVVSEEQLRQFLAYLKDARLERVCIGSVDFYYGPGPNPQRARLIDYLEMWFESYEAYKLEHPEEFA